MVAAALPAEGSLKNVIPRHLECISAKLRETGRSFRKMKILCSSRVQAHPPRECQDAAYPGFPDRYAAAYGYAPVLCKRHLGYHRGRTITASSI